MARSHSSYTASPTRWRSPRRSPARRPPSEDGSQYEMDLDALGLNSTFDSTGLGESHQPKVDVVETSDIEGPEDFTMNMTYWMTADLPLKQQIKSRKEANVNIAEVRGDARDETDGTQDTTAEGDKAVIEESSRDREVDADFNSASPTMRANGTTDGRQSGKALSDSSMENDEKVRSYLSALPDTDIPADALTSTPLRIPKQNMLQVPSPSPARARSMQATVEDYDTPRKPTQETVIHHPQERSAEIDKAEKDSLRKQVEELKLLLEQKDLASKTRITELETILSYTRSELETARADGFKQKGQISTLQQDNERQKMALDASRASMDVQLKMQEEELSAKMQEFGEEMRLQSLAKLQNQRGYFERQLRALEEAKRTVDEDMKARGRLLEEVKTELNQLRQSHEQKLQDMKSSGLAEPPLIKADFAKERAELKEQLTSLQCRADTFRAELEKATADAKAAREEAEKNETLLASTKTSNEAYSTRISDLEFQRQSLQSQLESARADVVTKDLRLKEKADLDSRLKGLQSELESTRRDADANKGLPLQKSGLESRLQSLQSQLESARADAVAKDQQILRQITEQEGFEQRVNTAQGRIESLESAVSTLRQQLLEAQRDSAKARTDAERFERDLEDATERLQDARIEADRRVADVEKKLAKMRESKAEAEARFKELQSQHDELVEDHEAKLEDVRDKAEDAVRKAGALIEQERTERKKIMKDLKKTSKELEQLRTEVAQKAAAEEEASSVDESTSISSSQINAKDTEMENLRTLIRTQASTLKSLKSETTSLRKENKKLKAQSQEAETTLETISTLQTELTIQRTQIETLKAEAETREQHVEAVNKAMDERLATLLSRAVKERAKTAVGKRDGQWVDKMSKVKDEREFMGRVLMREWGRQEVGAAEEGERQGYRYKYMKRT